MKRIVVVLLATTLLMLGAAAPAVGEGVGSLEASFQAGLGGGFAIVAHSDNAVSVAAPQTNPEGRILPYVDGQEFCSDTVLGTWILIADTTPELLDQVSNEFVLDGVVLTTQRTPNKRVTFNLFDVEGLEWWFAEGVPVLGTLDLGQHTLDWTITEAGTPFEISITFDVVDCGA